MLWYLEIIGSIKTDSSCLGKYICRSFRTIYCSVWDMNIRHPPTSRCLCWGMFDIMTKDIDLAWEQIFCENLLSVMHILSNLISKRLRKVSSSFMCEDNDDIFKCNEKSCCFILTFLNSSVSKWSKLMIFSIFL